MNKFALALFIAIAPPVLSGCGGSLSNVCVEANAAIASVGAYVDEAQYAIDRARKLAEALPSELRDEALVAVAASEASLFAVTQTATKISRQCAAFDLPTMFRDFADTWDAVKAVLDTFGGGVKSVGLVDPGAYELGKSTK